MRSRSCAGGGGCVREGEGYGRAPVGPVAKKISAGVRVAGAHGTAARLLRALPEVAPEERRGARGVELVVVRAAGVLRRAREAAEDAEHLAVAPTERSGRGRRGVADDVDRFDDVLVDLHERAGGEVARRLEDARLEPGVLRRDAGARRDAERDAEVGEQVLPDARDVEAEARGVQTVHAVRLRERSRRSRSAGRT